MASAPQAKPSMRAAFALPAFRTLWIGQFVSIFGDFLAVFAMISLITFRWHGTPAQITYVMIAYMLPLAIISPIAGVFVDRLHVKPVMIASDLIRGVLVLALPFVDNLWGLCAVFTTVSVVSSFFTPAQSVTVRTIVPRETLLAANALMSQAFYTVRLVSPIAAGALVAWLGEQSCFYLDAFSFFFSATMISLIQVVREPAPGSKSLKGFFSDLTSGNRFIFTHHSLAFVITSMCGAMFVLSCLSPLFSIYVRDVLHSGTFMYGVVSAGVGVGMIVGTQVVPGVGRKVSKKALVIIGLLVCGTGVGLLALAHVAIGAVGTTLAMGFGISFVIVAAQTLMQQETPHEMLGRVSSSFMSVFSFAQVGGLLLSGQLAVWIGIRQVFAVCGLALGLIAALGYQRHKATQPAPAGEAAGA